MDKVWIAAVVFNIFFAMFTLHILLHFYIISKGVFINNYSTSVKTTTLLTNISISTLNDHFTYKYINIRVNRCQSGMKLDPEVSVGFGNWPQRTSYCSITGDIHLSKLSLPNEAGIGNEKLKVRLPFLMYSFHRSRLRADLEILYDRGVDFHLILDGRFVLGCPWLNLTGRGQYQTGLIFSTTTMI